MFRVKNLCPHAITIHGDPPLVYEPSGQVARVAEEPGQPIDGYPFPATTASRYGQGTGLPDPEEGTLYVVSVVVAVASPTRADVFYPGEAVRDDAGQIVGVKNLKQVPR
jgi:hypothetical protein